MKVKFSFLISTKNRIEELKITLQKSAILLTREDVECLIYDDASIDNTTQFIKDNYPNIKLFTNTKSKGYLYNRNYLLNNCIGNYAISLDDDSNFLTENCLEIIDNHFNFNKKCGLIAFRIFWNKKEPENSKTNHSVEQVNGFVGCGHVWNMKAWNAIPNYPEWFEFYGEENFASLQLLKKDFEIHYVPQILVHHRVNVSERKKDKDYQIRRRRSLRAGWYNYFIFYPISAIPNKMAYSVWQQIKNYTFKGNVQETLAMLKALGDLLLNCFNIYKTSNRLSKQDYNKFINLSTSKIYWKPEHEK